MIGCIYLFDDKYIYEFFKQFLDENPKVVGQDDDNFIIKCDIHGEVKIPKKIFSNRRHRG